MVVINMHRLTRITYLVDKNAALIVVGYITTRHGASKNGATILSEDLVTLSDLLRERAETDDTASDIVDGVYIQGRIVTLAESRLHLGNAISLPFRVDVAGDLEQIERDAMRSVGGANNVHLLGDELIL
jgi:hypothetical protein